MCGVWCVVCGVWCVVRGARCTEDVSKGLPTLSTHRDECTHLPGGLGRVCPRQLQLPHHGLFLLREGPRRRLRLKQLVLQAALVSDVMHREVVRPAVLHGRRRGQRQAPAQFRLFVGFVGPGLGGSVLLRALQSGRCKKRCKEGVQKGVHGSFEEDLIHQNDMGEGWAHLQGKVGEEVGVAGCEGPSTHATHFQAGHRGAPGGHQREGCRAWM